MGSGSDPDENLRQRCKRGEMEEEQKGVRLCLASCWDELSWSSPNGGASFPSKSCGPMALCFQHACCPRLHFQVIKHDGALQRVTQMS